jgi:vesicle-associated membrane protein-associated protein B
MQNLTYIEVNPNDLVLFDDVTKKASSTFVTLRNITSRRVAFKIKTTSPKEYIVKPNSGIINANDSKKIEFTMHATDFVPSSKNSQDKFMIMAVALDDNFEVSKVSDIWKETSQDVLQQLKLTAGFKGMHLPPGQVGGRVDREVYEDVEGRNSVGSSVGNRLSMPVGNRQSNQLFHSTASPARGTHKNAHGDDYEKLVAKVAEQEKQILRLNEERTSLFNELTNLKESVDRNKMSDKGNKGNYSSYQVWHMLLVAIISLIVGAFLSA